MTATLITGADGYIGQGLARWLLQHDVRRLLLFVRANDDAEQAAKKAALGTLAYDKRCDVVFGDLRDAQPFDQVDPADVDGILHAAAVTNFAVEKQTARAVNIDGTEKVCDFARRCPNLRRLGLVSSIYAAGTREGVIKEARIEGQPQFANHYEWSKWSAEVLVGEQSALPWQIYRVATVMGEDDSGYVVQQNVIHNTLRLLFYGLLSVLPGDPETRIYTLSGAFLTDAIGRLFLNGADFSVYHVSESGSSAVTLGEMTGLVYDIFLEDGDFARRRILKPLFCDRDAFTTLVEAAGQLGGVVGDALGSIARFAPQLYCDKDVRTNRTDAALGGAQSPASRQFMRAVSEQLVRTRWGLKEAV